MEDPYPNPADYPPPFPLLPRYSSPSKSPFTRGEGAAVLPPPPCPVRRVPLNRVPPAPARANQTRILPHPGRGRTSSPPTDEDTPPSTGTTPPQVEDTVPSPGEGGAASESTRYGSTSQPAGFRAMLYPETQLADITPPHYPKGWKPGAIQPDNERQTHHERQLLKMFSRTAADLLPDDPVRRDQMASFLGRALTAPGA